MSTAGTGSARRILVVGINFTPELTGIGKYTGEMVDWLEGESYDVRVVTAPPYYPHWRVQPGFSSRWYAGESRGTTRLVRCPLWVPKRPTGLKRILHLGSFALSSFPVVLWQAVRWRPDVVITVEPPLICAPAAWVGARLSGARAWLHIQDLEVDAAFDLGMIKGAWLRKLVLRVESALIRRFDRVTTISERMLERVRRKGVNCKRASVFPNWVDTDLIRAVANSDTPMRKELGLNPKTCVLLYSGNMGEKQGLEILLEVAERITDLDVLLLMCGAGAARGRLEERARGMSNVRFIPLQPLDRLNDLLNTADIHLLPQRGDAADLVMPSKLVTMMASGRPVIATAGAGTQVASAVQGCGLVVPPGDATALEHAIRDLAQDGKLRMEYGAAARARAVSDWDKNSVLAQAFAWIETPHVRKGSERGSVKQF